MLNVIRRSKDTALQTAALHVLGTAASNNEAFRSEALQEGNLVPAICAVLETLGTAAVSYQIVLTKADELKKGELDKRMADTMQKIEKRAAAYPEILPTSSRTGFGIPELRAGIAKLLTERGAG